ncbi:hypothetical protein BXY66_2751 [Shimia isoporae]|uniref:Uncharacterized protein n=1 Tax=Shimia isoporae TaxID=647720 RepID=A0A4R1N466_9RHOB|nr:hypothetical protein BXY66_2751 [Shimia isoporae]
MTMIADILLVAGALGASVYCYVLARRLAKFNDLEAGVGGAVAVLSTQVDELTRSLKAAQATAGTSTKKLEDLTKRAETASKRMELLLASMHDLPDPEDLKAFKEAQSTTRFVRHSDEEIGTPSDSFEEGGAFASSKPEEDVQGDVAEEKKQKQKRNKKKRRNRKAAKVEDVTTEDAPEISFRRAG